MSKLDSLEVRITPYVYIGSHGGEEKLYEVSITVDGKRLTSVRPTVSIPPHMTELEVLTKMIRDIQYNLRKDDDTDE